MLRTIKGLALAMFRIDLALARTLSRLRGEAPFRLGGACRRSGACCEAPAIRVGAAPFFLPTLRRLLLAWQRRVNGFELTGVDREQRTFVFRCTHFDAATRECDSYDSRPGICRDYPRVLLWQPHPELMPGCGHRPIARNAGALLAELERQKLPPEQLARVKKGLFLE